MSGAVTAVAAMIVGTEDVGYAAVVAGSGLTEPGERERRKVNDMTEAERVDDHAIGQRPSQIDVFVCYVNEEHGKLGDAVNVQPETGLAVHAAPRVGHEVKACEANALADEANLVVVKNGLCLQG